MRKILFTGVVAFIFNSYASCPLLTDNQLKTITTSYGYTVDGNYGHAVYGFNQNKCLYQIRSHKDSTAFILTYNPMTNQMQDAKQKGFYFQYFDDEYTNYSN